MAIAAVGFGLLTHMNGSNDRWLVVVGSVIFSFGLIPVITLATDLILGTVPPERAGTASGLSETSSEFGGALGIALLGSAATAVYRHELGDTLPRGVPQHIARAAQETLGGALSVAGQLPGAAGFLSYKMPMSSWLGAATRRI